MEIAKVRVLVVDDMEAMRKINASQLRSLGFAKITEVENGSAALKALKSNRFDLILSDWNMPVMDGLELLQAIRTNSAWSSMPFILVTAESERSKVELAVKSGVTDLLIKPFTLGRLKERVLAALDGEVKNKNYANEVKTNSVQLSSSKTRSQKQRILIVDDVTDNLSLLAGLLKEDYRIMLAKDGGKALQICQSDDPPDLVLLDVMMPGIDGFEVLRRMRLHPASGHIPVIFVSALGETEHQVKGLSGGAVDYITKPVQPAILRLRVKNLMHEVTLRRNLQQDYQQMIEHQRLKDDVDQILRHDMKGPLAGIVALARQSLDQENSNVTLHQHLALIEDLASRGLDSVNNSAELFKIETGRFKLDAHPFSIRILLERVCRSLAASFETKEIKVELNQGDTVTTALGDESLTQSALFNVLKNAYEAAPEKSIINVKIEIDEPNVLIKVYNKGVIPETMRERFWDKFSSVGKSQGTGLGTYSTKLLIEAQNGKVRMQTDDEQSVTRISVLLPKAI